MHAQPFDLAGLVQKAEAGDSSAQFHLGVRYKDGSLVPQDRDSAKFWFMKAVDQNNDNATVFMANMLREERTPASTQLALDLLKMMNERHAGYCLDQRCHWDAFDIYAPGCEFLREKETLLLLSNNGHVEAQLEIVRQYLVHRGVLDDRSAGLAWWVMPVFGIVPSVLHIAPSPDHPPFDEEPAISIALRNFRRAEEWIRIVAAD